MSDCNIRQYSSKTTTVQLLDTLSDSFWSLKSSKHLLKQGNLFLKTICQPTLNTLINIVGITSRFHDKIIKYMSLLQFRNSNFRPCPRVTTESQQVYRTNGTIRCSNLMSPSSHSPHH